MTSTQPLCSGLVARTRSLDDPRPLLDWLDDDGFAWIRDDVGFVTAGMALEVSAADAAATLRSIEGDDDVDLAGTGPIAVGALPFDRPQHATLMIPTRVVGRTGDGATWITELEHGESFVHAPRALASSRARPGDDRVSWEAKVRDVLGRIAREELHKLVLAREVVVDAELPFDRNAVLARLLAMQPGCFAYAAPGLVGASPELLVRRVGDAVVSRPMAGTVARRDGDNGDDAGAIKELAESAKDALEHRLVVEEVVRILEGVCDDVRASAVPEIARFSTVAHLATRITARVRDRGVTALDLALALHPTPAVAGCPTGAALSAIGELEHFDRGRYAGPVGWVGADGDGEWAIALRGAELLGRRARVRAGAGIVAGSDPGAEWAETEAKLASVLAALRFP